MHVYLIFTQTVPFLRGFYLIQLNAILGRPMDRIPNSLQILQITIELVLVLCEVYLCIGRKYLNMNIFTFGT